MPLTFLSLSLGIRLSLVGICVCVNNYLVPVN